jgi:hypothetical protein
VGAQQVADLDQQLDLGRLRRAGLLTVGAPLDERLHRQHDEEVDDRRGQHEGDHPADGRAPGDHLLVGLEAATQLPAAAGEADQRRQERLGELVDDGRGRRADDDGDGDGDGELDDVAAQQGSP